MTRIHFYHLTDHFCNLVSVLLLISFSLILLLADVVLLSANTVEWEAIPLRSPDQKIAGLAGGEGFQQVQAIVYAPSDPNIVYAGVDTSQVWKSTNGGSSWYSQKHGIVSNGALSLIVDPINPDIVFAAGSLSRTYEKTNHALDPLQGIYRTTDGGKKWNLVHRTEFYKRESKGSLFVFDTSSVEDSRTPVVYAGSHSEGLLRSLDGGNTWDQIDFGGEFILDLKENPARPGELFIATRTGLYSYYKKHKNKIGKGLPDYPRTIAVSPSQSSTVYAALGKAGVFKSKDQGNTFSAVGGMLPPFVNYTDIAVSPANVDTVYLKADQSRFKKPYYSHNGALDWHSAHSTNYKNLIPDDDGFWFSSPFAPHPLERYTALTVSNGRARILKTVDGGKNWGYSGNGYNGGRMLDISFTKEAMLFFLVDHGVWYTEDNGDSFTELKVKKIFNSRSSSSGDINGDTIVASIGQWRKKGLIVSHDRGTTWKTYNNLIDIYRFISFHPKQSNIIYAGPYRSDDKGHTWQKLQHIIRAMSPQNGDMVYSIQSSGKNKSRVSTSIDRGANWKSQFPALPFPARMIQDIAIAPDNPNRIYLATFSGVWIFNGKEWSQRGQQHGLENDFFGQNNIQTLAVDPHYSNVIYAGKIALGRGVSNGIFRSLDSGETWQDITGTLGPNLTVWAIRVNPVTHEVFIGTSLGTFKSTPLARDLHTTQ